MKPESEPPRLADDRDRTLDHALRAAFEPPSSRRFADAARTAAPAPRAPLAPWLLAAAALITALTFALRPERRGPEGHDGRALGAMWLAAYEDAVARGFDGPSCCEPGLDLPAECAAVWSAPLELREDGDLSLLGGYAGLPTGGCLTLLAERDGTPVCIHVLPRRLDPRVTLPDGSGLHLARRELGELVVYALSRQPADAALAQFVVPEQ